MKRIICLLLILCIVPLNFSYADDSALEADYKGMLDYLGISTNISGEFVTRGELMMMACGLLGLKNLPNEEISYFTDVPYDSPQLKYINQMVNLGYARGSDGLFYPERPSTIAEFVTMMIRVTGYDVLAEIKGGYPTGYLVCATSNRILRSGMPVDQPVDIQTAIKLLYNTVNAPYLKMVSFSQNPEYESSTTILYEIFKCEKYSGVVTATDKTELYGSANTDLKTVDIVSGSVRTNYRDKFYTASEYLGYNIEFLLDVSEMNEENIVYATPVKNQTHEIDKRDIDSIDNLISSIKYSIDYKEYQARLAQNVAFIYNGEGAFGITPADLMSRTGRLKLISNDGDNLYDVVIVEAYDNSVVETVNKSAESVSVKFPINGEKIISLSDENFENIYIYKNGIRTEFASIATEDVISYGISKSGKTVWAYVSSKSVKGKITEITDEAYIIDDVEYLINDQFLLNYPDMKIGLSGRFGLDKYDNLVFFKADAGDGTTKYGYLLSAAKPKDMNNARYKVLKSDGDIEIFNIADKAKLYVDNVATGENLNTTSKIFAVDTDAKPYTNHQIISYELNSNNEIKDLYIAEAVQPIEDKVQTGLELNADNSGSSLRYYASALGLLYYLDKTTSMYYITTEKGGRVVADEYCYVSDNSRLSDYENVSCKLYNVSYDRIPKFVTIQTELDGAVSDPSEENTYMNHLLVIEKISTVIDKDGAQSYKVSGAFNGKITDYTVVRGGEVYEKLRNAQPGQAWRVIPNKNGEIAGATLIFNPVFLGGLRKEAGDPLCLDTEGIYRGKTPPVLADFTFDSRNQKPNYMVGSVYYKSTIPNAIHIEYFDRRVNASDSNLIDEETYKMPYFLDGSLKICVFDYKTKKLTMGGIADIGVDSSSNKIFSANRGGFPRTLIVFKNIY